jgi:ABC-type transporter Mla MlaB component
MATRSKKKVAAMELANQEPENTVKIEDTASEVQVNCENIISTDDILNLTTGSANPQHFESYPSEDNMVTDRELTETRSSDEEVFDAGIEPAIDLEANLSIQNVVKLYDKLKKIYVAHDTIEIDASHVASIDTASLQLLVALKKDAIKQNKTVDFFQPSPRFVESARLLDLLDILEIIDV